jgi:hypothetical protein
MDKFLEVFNEFEAVVDLRALQGKGKKSKYQQLKLFNDI